MANCLLHQQRCLSPSWSYLARRDGIFSLDILKVFSCSCIFHLVPAYISCIQPLSPLIYLRCPIGLTSYIDKGAPSIPPKYALHMHCIMYLWHVATHTVHDKASDLRNRIHTYQLPIWVLAPEASAHILVSPALSFPFEFCLRIRIRFEISFHSLKGTGSSIVGPYAAWCLSAAFCSHGVRWV